MAKPRTSSEDVLPPANLIVVCLEGCHGCGKTSVCAELRKRGVNVLGASHRVLSFSAAPRYARVTPY